MVVELNYPWLVALRVLIIQRHDKIKFELPDLAARIFIPSVVRDEPQIYPGRSANVEEIEGMSTPTEERGDRQWKDGAGLSLFYL